MKIGGTLVFSTRIFSSGCPRNCFFLFLMERYEENETGHHCLIDSVVFLFLSVVRFSLKPYLDVACGIAMSWIAILSVDNVSN